MKPHHSAAGAPTKTRPVKAKAAAASTPVAAENPTTAAPSADREDSIRETAYYYFEARGGVGGYELEDWLRAEAEFERLHRDGAAQADELTASH